MFCCILFSSCAILLITGKSAQLSPSQTRPAWKTQFKKNFALQHATSIIEKKRVETRSLKKATVAWLHLALISDTHRSTTGIKKLHLRYNLYTEEQYSFNVLVSFQHVGLALKQITHMIEQSTTFCTCVRKDIVKCAVTYVSGTRWMLLLVFTGLNDVVW